MGVIPGDSGAGTDAVNVSNGGPVANLGPNSQLASP